MERHRHYYLLIYQVPSKPTAARVGVWRELKRLGVLYLQQSACIVPSARPIHAHLQRITARIESFGGDYHLLPMRSLPADEEAKVINGFLKQSNLQYGEIIENCEVNFSKEIEFEIFRENFSYAEAEEIRQDLDKIRRWYERVVERDWFGASRREETAGWIARCEKLLEEFEERVFAVQRGDEAGHQDDAPGILSESDRPSVVPIARAKARRGAR